MEKKFYTVDQVSQMLNIHPKTVRKYIREGDLRATKVGKQWRITGHDLSLFTEVEENAIFQDNYEISNCLSNNQRISVSAVIEILVRDRDEVDRISGTLLAIMNSKDAAYGKSSINTQFIEKENKLRVMLWGTVHFVETLLSCIPVLVDKKDERIDL